MTVLVPESLDAACAALAARPETTVLAGGTDLMVGINAGRVRPSDVLAVGRLPELRGWRVDGDEVVLGAAVTYTELLDGPIPLLRQASRSVGSPQIRNAGTLGGNLGTASPAGDGVVALVALGGTVQLRSTDGERSVDLASFVLGPRRTARRPDELIVSARVPVPNGPQEFLKVGTRNAMVIAVASAALVVDGPVVRLALGSVGPGPIRCTEAEVYATAGGRDASVFASLAASAAAPIDDHRSSADYRRRAVEVIVRRAFERAFDA